MEKTSEEWAHYASVLRPLIKEPVRTLAELEEKRKMDAFYQKQIQIRWNTFQKIEQRQIKLKIIALEELPSALREAAMKIDETPFPANFIVPTWDVPIEGDELFGEYQRPGSGVMVGDSGVMPYPIVPSEYEYPKTL